MPTPTFTSKLALTKPDPNPTTGDFVDVSTLNTDFDKIDDAIGTTAATSGARPASPFAGQLIRESDTRKVRVWNPTQATWDPVTGTFVGTSGARPATPSDGMLYRETDTRRLAVYNGTSTAWETINGAFVCTSGTRPGVLFDGMIIRETDTRRVYIWNATQSAWELVYNGLAAPPAGTMFAARTSNSAGKQNNTMAADSQLVVPVVAGTYIVDSQIIYTSPTTAGFQAGWSAPGSSTFSWSSWGPGSAVTASEGVTKYEGRSLAVTALLGGAGATVLTLRPGGLLVSGGSGSLTFRWAQQTTIASDTVVQTDSWVRAVRVA
jgi:hypothetical protein